MSASSHSQLNKLCALCLKTPWSDLQPEDSPAHPHQPSRSALEASAKSCPLCKLVLRAATTNSQSNASTRYGKGVWRTYTRVRMFENGSIREVNYESSHGACVPAGSSTYDRGFGSRLLMMPTGTVDHNMEHVESLNMPDIENLNLDSSADSLPVWVYGNYWASKAPLTGHLDPSCLRLMGIGARFARSSRIFDAVNNTSQKVILCGSAISVCTNDDSIFDHIPGRVPEHKSGSERALARLEKWASNCKLSHSSCQPPAMNPALPTRTIDVTDSERTISIIETKGQRGRYIALSHCWGTSPRILLTSETSADLENGIAVSFLPKTFRDAIFITKKLGIRYLWIDCLCIIQDDPLDWEREAATMGQVYRNAYLTVAADASTDSYTGCLPERDSDVYISPATVSLGYNRTRSTRDALVTLKYSAVGTGQPQHELHLFEEWLPGSMAISPQRIEIGTFGKRYDPISTSPLSTRGWALQERILSQRIIHYAQDQMFYECDSCLLSEDGFVFPRVSYSFERLVSTQQIAFQEHGMPRDGSISLIVGKHADFYKGIRWEGGWIALIEDYCRRKLTKPEDKLIALAGLARLIAQETGDEYYAGIWAKHLYEDLSWRVYAREELPCHSHDGVPEKGKVLGEVVAPPNYRAPTWSWASLDGPIRFVALSYHQIVARVRDCQTKPAGADKFGRVSAGQLDIEAPLFQIFPYKPKKTFRRHGIPVYIDFGDDRKKSVGGAFLDFPDAELKFPCYALFLDPANAIIVHSNGNVCQLTERDMTAAQLAEIKEKDDGKILDTVSLRGMIADNPSLKGRVFKALFDTERIGYADFVKGHRWDDDGFPVPVEDWPTENWDPKKSRTEKTSHEESGAGGGLGGLAAGNSWGPVNQDDPKVWVTVL